MSDRDDVWFGIDSIIQETMSFDFPFWANRKKKGEIIVEKKAYIEEQLRRLAPEAFPSDTELEQTWKETLEHTNHKFESLPLKIKINGFYLQELMNFYSEKLVQQMMKHIMEV